jgi:hypothetical protein
MGPNPAGPRDENVRLLRLTRADGRDRAVVWNYTCHPTGFPNHDCVTAEYPGVVRESLRQACSARDLPVLCLQGYCGDVRPPFVAPVKGFVSLARRICVGPGLSHGTTEQWANWAKSLAAKVCAAHSSATTLPFNGRLASASAVVPMKELATGADPGTGLGITSISLGDELRLVALDAEPVAAYREIVEGVFPGERLMTVGYTNRVFGYLPVDSMLPQGGYEVAGFRTPFRFSGTFRPGIDETVRGALLRIKQSG